MIHIVRFVLSIAAGLLTLAAYWPYVRAIVRRETIPSPVSWWIWSLVGLLLLSTYAAGGGEAGLWLACSAFAGQVLVALLSIKYGKNAFTVIDLLCVCGAVIAAVTWWITASPYLPHALVLLIDICAWYPTFQKTLRDPQSEDLSAWVLWTLGALSSLAAVQSVQSFEAAYPIYIVISDGIVAVLLLRNRIQKNRRGSPGG